MIAKAALQRLKDAPWLRDPATQKVFSLLDGEKGKTRAVGGAIRDTLVDFDREATEVDFATELLPAEVMRRAGEAGVAVYPTGIEHGTVTLKVDDRIAEVTTLREDIETDGRHAVVRFGWGWTRDAERRDFTMNALYCDMEGELFDPINGVEDCVNGVVRFIGDANRRIAEDKLRVYRFFRFTASHGHEQFDEDGLVAIHKASADLGNISSERIGGEMRRIIALPRIARTLEAMVETGVLDLAPDLLERMGTYDAVEVAATFAGWTEAGKSAIVEHLTTVEVPQFPISGGDLLQRGMKPGPRIGAELDRLEQKWIKSGFKLDRNALLSSVQR